MEIIIALIYVFHQFFSANLDLFYFLSIILIIFDIINRKKLTWKAIGYVYLIVIYALFQILMNDQIEIDRLVINIAKLFLNVFLFLQIREMMLTINSLKKIVHMTSFINLLLLLVGLVYKTNLLWRLDDNVNIYQKVRFALAYAEPSEASFHACLLIVLLFYLLLREKNHKRNLLNLFFLLTNAVVVVLSAGMGGMLSLSLALLVMYFYYLREKINVEKTLMMIILFISASFALILFITSNNSFYMRLTDILNGNDGSVVYRFNISARIMEQILLNSNFMGTGWGNLNTDAVRNTYYSNGLVQVIANSFMYVIAEGGIAAILLLLVFLIMLRSRVQKSEKMMKYGLYIFIFSYQIAGGYFTNPVNWIVYGLIANKVYLHRDVTTVLSYNTYTLKQLFKKRLNRISN